MSDALQWGARFAAPPDRELIAFGSSLEDDLVLAPFDVACSEAHVVALRGGGIIDDARTAVLQSALAAITREIASGKFATFARAGEFEDVHGAIDARVRELAGTDGDWLHAGRSRNDQVATTLVLFAREDATCAARQCTAIAWALSARARDELQNETMLAGTTHWQPAQPMLLAFYIEALAEMFLRAARRFARVARDASAWSPLGSGALAGSSLPLDRAGAAAALGLGTPSRNALDSVGTRDVLLDLAHAFVRAVVDASRASEEFVIWCSPAYGYAKLSDAASTGSSLMPQKRNPDPFELIRSQAALLNGLYAGAIGTLCGLAISYHRDLQTTKKLCLEVSDRGMSALRAFDRALRELEFDRNAMGRAAGGAFTVATDLADKLIAAGTSARDAHAQIGSVVARAEADGAALQLTPDQSVRGKRTTGSTAPQQVAAAIAALERDLDAVEAAL